MKRVALAASLLACPLATMARADEPPPPARHLRSLAHRPQAYGADTIPGDLLLGDLLFHSPRTLGPRARAMGLSCQTCHPNGAAAIAIALPAPVGGARPGSVDLSTAHFREGADDGIVNSVDIPSLRGVRSTAPYGRDGRTASLAEFTADVISGEFDGAPLSPARLRALVRYLDELDFLPNANLDERGRLRAATSESARRGEHVFQRDCASCHVPSSYFVDGRVHRVGSGAPASPAALDDGYETPTLLGLAESAPYLHDGRCATLAEVVDFFAARLALQLTPSERADLIAYLSAVGAVQPARDTRPLGQQLVEGTAYLALLTGGEWQRDRDVWTMALEESDAAIARHTISPLLVERINAARGSLHALLDRVAAGAPLDALVPEVRRLREELPRLAADWTGARSRGE